MIKTKKLLSLLLSGAMVFSLFPVNTFATEEYTDTPSITQFAKLSANTTTQFNEPAPISGVIAGDGYSFENGILTISSNAGTTAWRSAVSDKNAVKSVVIESDVTQIGRSAFEYCYDLTAITIPDTVTSIEPLAFKDCYDLTAITIPDTVTSIGANAFDGCKKLATVTINSPGQLQNIGDGAFYDCSKLATITIPATVTSIGDSVFSNCNSLTRITVASGNANYSDVDGVLFNANKTSLMRYPIGKTTTTYTVPDTVISIEEGVFRGCVNLETVTITTSSSLQTIGYNAFKDCSKLTEITIPNGVTSIRFDAFFGCNALTSVYFHGSYPSVDSRGMASIPNGAIKVKTDVTGDWETYNYSSDQIIVETGNSQVYDGTKKTFTPTVKQGNTTFDAGTDYTVSNNTATNVGIHQLTITGRGFYSTLLSGDYDYMITEGASQTGEIVISNGGTVVYGDTITVKFTPKATGTAPANFKAKSLADNAPTQTAELWLGETQLATVNNVTENQAVTFTVDTTNTALFPHYLFDGTTAHTLTVKWGGDDNLSPTSDTTTITLSPKTVGDFHIIGGTESTDYTYTAPSGSDLGKLEIKTDTPLIIANADPSTATDEWIGITSTATDADVTLNGVNIDTTSYRAFQNYGDNATVTFTGSNTLGGYNSGISINSPATFTGEGTLIAKSSGNNNVYMNSMLTIQPEVTIQGRIYGFRVDGANSASGTRFYYGELDAAITETNDADKNNTITVEHLGTTPSVESIAITSDITLVVDNGARFNVSANTLTNEGVITNNGTLNIFDGKTLDCSNGIITGNAPVKEETGAFIKMNNNLASVSQSDVSYGTAVNPTVAYTNGATETNGGAVKVEYKLTAEDDTTYSETVPTDAGDYTLRATSAETELAQAGEKTDTFEITQIGYTDTKTATGTAKYGTSGSVDLSAWATLDGVAFSGATKTGQEAIIIGTPTIANNKLSFILADNVDNVGDTATITIPVTTTNYTDFDLTVTVTVNNKNVPTVTANAIIATYTGEAMANSSIKGTSSVGGTWEFVDEQSLINVADSGIKNVVFKPTDSENYAEVRTTVNVTIEKSTPTGTPTFSEITEVGKTLADGGLDIGTITPTGGTIAWDDELTTAVEIDKSYTWTYTPKTEDQANYKILTGTHVFFRTPTSGSGGGSSSTTDNTINSEENVTADDFKEFVESGENLTVNGDDNIEIEFDSDALEAILGEADGKDVEFIAKEADEADLNEEQKFVIGNNLVLDLQVLVDGEQFTDFETGEVSVSVPYELEEGESAANLKVYYVDDEGNKTLIPSEFVDGVLTFKTNHFSLYMVTYEVMSFEDVLDTDWFYEAVIYAYENSLMNGISDTEFDPNGSTTRAMMWTVLARMDGVDTEVSEGEMWYSVAQNWAIENEISDGTEPDGLITREQFVTMLYRYEQAKGGGFVGTYAFPLDFPDAEKVSEWAWEATLYMTMVEVITGMDNGNLNPQGDATRAEIATMLMRYLTISAE